MKIRMHIDRNENKLKTSQNILIIDKILEPSLNVRGFVPKRWINVRQSKIDRCWSYEMDILKRF